MLNEDEVRWLWLATDGGGVFAAVVRLLLLLAQRRGEVAEMPPSELDLAREQIWTIPPVRTKNGREQRVPLPPSSVETIQSLPAIARRKFIFSIDGKKPLSGWSKAKLGLDQRMLEVARQEATEKGDDPAKVHLVPWRLHDLRRTAASGMARLGTPIHIVEAVLNHKSGAVSGVAAIYNRYDYLDEKRHALQAWASEVERLAVPAGGNNIVRLSSARSRQ